MLLSTDTLWATLLALLLSITQLNRTAAFGIARHEAAPTLNTHKYHNYEGVLRYLDNLAEAFPKRVALTDVGTTYENRTLRTITITNGDGRVGKKVIFVVATEHAREWLTPVAALYTVEQLVLNVQENAELLQDYDWMVLPVANPDGYEYSLNSNREWRSNRSPNGGNCFGTNLNRNFDVGWLTGYPELADPCDEHYAGIAPFSELESQAMRNIMQNLVKTSRAFMFLTLHSRHRCVFYPWTYKSDAPDNEQRLREVAAIGAAAMQSAAGTEFTFDQAGSEDPFGGTSIDYAYSIGFPFPFTLELAGVRGQKNFSFWPPTYLLKDLADESWLGIRAMAVKAIELYSMNSNSVTTLSNSNSSSAINLSSILKILLLLSITSLFSRKVTIGCF